MNIPRERRANEAGDFMKTETSPMEPGAIGSTTLLGSSGFVFVDDRPWPYLVRQESSGDWRLYYWRDSIKQFATMRKIAFEEMLAFRERALPSEKAALYLPNNCERHSWFLHGQFWRCTHCGKVMESLIENNTSTS